MTLLHCLLLAHCEFEFDTPVLDDRISMFVVSHFGALDPKLLVKSYTGFYMDFIAKSPMTKALSPCRESLYL